MADARTALSIPRPTPGLAPFEVDLSLAYQAEARLKEIATANSGNALHLASIFARAYDSLGRCYGELYREVGVATVSSRKRRARIILDLAPGIVKEKGLSSIRSPNGAADIREAICYADEEYTAIENYRAGLEAAKELVFIKLQAVRMGYDAMRAILKGTSSSAGNGVHETGRADEGTLLDDAMTAVNQAEQVKPHPAAPEVDVTPPESLGRRSWGVPL